jgi:hypothetical protein
MGPDLSNVSHIVPVGVGIFLRHHLDIESPCNRFTFGKHLIKILLQVVVGPLLCFLNLLRKQWFVLEIGLDVVLNKEGFPLLINPLISVSAKAVHVFVSIWDPSI